MEKVTIMGQEITLDLLVWRRFKRPTPGLVEQILAINPQLETIGPFLPKGTVVNIPDPPPAKSYPAQQYVDLFGRL